VARNIESFYSSTSSIKPEGELTAERDIMGPSPTMEGGKKKVSVVVPLYNEIDNITAVVDDLESTLGSSHLDFEIILVDDGSTDGSLEGIRSLQNKYPCIHVISHGSNKGKTAALLTGFRYACGDFVVLMDGDGQFIAQDIPVMVRELERGYDVVNGWGKKSESEPLTKIIPSLIYNFISRKLFSLDVHQFNLGFKAFRRQSIQDLSLKKDEHRYILPLLKDRGFTISEVPVSYLPRKNGNSKYGIMRIPCGIMDMIALKIELVMGERPFRIFGMMSCGLIFLGGLLGLDALYLLLLGSSINMLLIAFILIFFLCGVTLLFVGYAVEAVTSPRQ